MIELNKPAKFQWTLAAYFDISNQNNCYRMVSNIKKNLHQNSKAPGQFYTVACLLDYSIIITCLR